MKKLLGILITLLAMILCMSALADVPIDSAHFPDPGFQEFLKTWHDWNKDGVLSDQELAVTSMDLGPGRLVEMHGDGSYEIRVTKAYTISSIEGIQYFPNIEHLVIRDQNLPVIDLSWMGTLTNLEACSSDNTISVTGPSGLVRLRCDRTPMTSLDVSRYPDLRILYCFMTNIASLDISNCPYLLEAYHGTKTEDSYGILYSSNGNELYIDASTTLITGEAPPATSEPPTEAPTPTPTPTSTPTPTPQATATPTPKVTETPMVTATPTPRVTATPTPKATATPTPAPTAAQDGKISGSFTNKKKTIYLGDQWFIEGSVSITSGKLSKVVIDCPTLKNSTMTCAPGSSQVTLKTYKDKNNKLVFIIDTTKAPWNKKGTYQLRLFAADSKGKHGDEVLATMELIIGVQSIKWPLPNYSNQVSAIHYYSGDFTDNPYGVHGSSLFGKKPTAIDIEVKAAKKSDVEVWAAANGKVTKVDKENSTSMGNYVVIEHYDKTKTVYGHMKSVSVSVGDDVKQGQKIGYVGNTNGKKAKKSVSYHLHFDWSGGSAWNVYFKYDTSIYVLKNTYLANLFYYDCDANSKAYCDWYKKTYPGKIKEIEKEQSKIIHEISGNRYSLRSGNMAVYLGPVDKSVKNLNIPATIKNGKTTYEVKIIDSGACSGLTSLQTVTISDKATTIGNGAFEGCTSLTSVTIGSNVNLIQAKAFSGCTSLKTIVLKTTKLTKDKIQKNAFSGISGEPTFKCPSSVLKKYKKFLPGKVVTN